MQSLTALIFLGLSFDKTRAQDPLDMDIGRTFTTIPDLTPFGVNLTSTFTSLLSPSGIVDQFSLSIVIQLIFVVGYVLSGLIFAALKSRITTGPLVETLNYFEIHLSAQVKCSL